MGKNLENEVEAFVYGGSKGLYELLSIFVLPRDHLARGPFGSFETYHGP